MKVGGCIGSGKSESRGSVGMHREMRKSSGKEAGTGRTFLATVLYASVRMGGSTGREL
jgi:hypothetical protein